MRKAEWEYINNTITQGLQTNNSKQSWKYIKSRKDDNIGVAHMKNLVHWRVTARRRLKSSWTSSRLSSPEMLDLPPPPAPHPDRPQHPIISHININTAGVCKLLKAINPHKACGPDQIPNLILKNCADTLVPALRGIFQQ